MLRELTHFARYAPYSFKLKVTLSPGKVYDHLMEECDRSGMAQHRASLVGDLSGRILEVGSGTGLMFPHYGPGAEVDAIEPAAPLHGMAARRAETSPADIALHDFSAEHLPFDDCAFDAAVVALVLCSVPRVPDALREIHRVLKPGAPLRLIEHVRSKRQLPGMLMHLFNPVWRRANGQGCNMNRDPIPHFEACGFAVEDTRDFQVFSPGIPAFPMIAIRALRR